MVSCCRTHHFAALCLLLRVLCLYIVSPVDGLNLTKKLKFSSDSSLKVVNNFKPSFEEVLHRAYVRVRRFHDLRNTAITSWFRNGMSEYDVMKLAGHADLMTTHKFYLAVADHLIDRARNAECLLLDNSLPEKYLGTGTDGLSSIDNQRSRRDSNPRNLSVQRFSRPSP